MLKNKTTVFKGKKGNAKRKKVLKSNSTDKSEKKSKERVRFPCAWNMIRRLVHPDPFLFSFSKLQYNWGFYWWNLFLADLKRILLSWSLAFFSFFLPLPPSLFLCVQRLLIHRSVQGNGSVLNRKKWNEIRTEVRKAISDLIEENYQISVRICRKRLSLFCSVAMLPCE